MFDPQFGYGGLQISIPTRMPLERSRKSQWRQRLAATGSSGSPPPRPLIPLAASSPAQQFFWGRWCCFSRRWPQKLLGTSSLLSRSCLFNLSPSFLRHRSSLVPVLLVSYQTCTLLHHSFFCTFLLIPPPHTTAIMQRAFSSRARATALSSAATKYRAGAGLGQQLRFAHKVCSFGSG